MEIKGEGKDIFTTGEGVLNKAVIAKIPFEDVSAKWKYEEGVLGITLDESKASDHRLPER